MSDEDKALVERLRGDWPEILVEKHWMMDSDAIDKQREEAANRIEAQAAEIEKLREALHTPLAFIEALHENDPDDQIADNGMTVLVERLQERADEIPQEQADLENEARGHCGPYGTDTADDYLDDCDRLLMLEAKDRIEQLDTVLWELDHIAENPTEFDDDPIKVIELLSAKIKEALVALEARAALGETK